MLDSPEVKSLANLIRDSFRIRENHTPIYVEIGDNFSRFSSAQQQVLFGRRGSGKSCLLVHFQNISDRDREVLSIYIGVDEIKRLGFPDVLIRILLTIFEKLPGARRTIFSFRRTPLRDVITELKTLLDDPDSANVSTKDSREVAHGVDVSGGSATPISARLSGKRGKETTKQFTSSKLDHLERHLQDYKTVFRQVLKSNNTNAYILVDDFYLIQRDTQPNVVDYLHRLLRGTDGYLKLATIRHRTTLRRHDGQTVGVELSQDIEEISLDKTFEDFEATHGYLHAMLQQMSNECSSSTNVAELFNPDAARALTLASGGVPRDFLNIFVEAIAASVRARKMDRLTPTFIYKASTSLSYKSKIANIKEEAGFDSASLDRLFVDIVNFCLKEKKKTVFLINHEEIAEFPTEHELLQQLMDFKLVHIVEANTSAASGRAGRYAAYTLDFSIFMEPRRRGIEIVEFWRTDDQRRPVGVRESPDYSLGRASVAISGADSSIDAVMDSLEVDDGAVELETAAPPVESGDPTRRLNEPGNLSP